MTRQQQDEICGTFKYICDKCNGATVADLMRGIYKANQKVDDMRLETFKKHNEILGKINTLVSALKDVLDDTAARDSSNATVYDRLNQINDEFIGAKRRIEALDFSIETKVTELVTLSNDMATRHVKALNEILDKTVEYQLSSTVIEPPHQPVQPHTTASGLSHESPFSLIPEDLFARVSSDFTVAVQKAVSPLSSELQRLQDDINALAEKLSTMPDVQQSPPATQSVFDELMSLHEEASIDLPDIVDDQSEEPHDWFANVLNGIVMLVNDFDLDICTFPFTIDTVEQLAISRNQNLKICSSSSKAKKKRLNKPEAKRTKEPRDLPGRYVRAPKDHMSIDESKPKNKRDKRAHTNNGNNNAQQAHPSSSPYYNASSHDNQPSANTWIYVSGLGNAVNVDILKDYVGKRIGSDEILCSPLLPKGVDPTTRRNLSFKIRIPSTFAHRVLNPHFWPSHVKVRYFVDSPNFTSHRRG